MIMQSFSLVELTAMSSRKQKLFSTDGMSPGAHLTVRLARPDTMPVNESSHVPVMPQAAAEENVNVQKRARKANACHLVNAPDRKIPLRLPSAPMAVKDVAANGTAGAMGGPRGELQLGLPTGCC